MKPFIFLSDVEHCRTANAVHNFNYKSLNLLYDICDRNPVEGLNYNRRGIFSLWDSDFLPGKSGSVYQRLIAYLADAQADTDWTRIEILTSPRFLGYVFNPVTFFLCYKLESGNPGLVVAQVNNTFGETHLYIAPPVNEGSSSRLAKFTAKKAFHVSPFFDREGEYSFYVERTSTTVDVRVNLSRQGATVFTSRVSATLREWDSSNLLQKCLWGASHGWMTLPRIVWQAALLRFRRGLKVYTKPLPNSSDTIGLRQPTLIEKASQQLLYKYFRKLQRGFLTLQLPSGETEYFGKSDSTPSATIYVKDWSFFTRLIVGGDIAFGETYTEGIWTCDRLEKVLELFALNVEFFNDRHIPFTKLRQILNTIGHRRRKNSTSGSKSNIPAHYDLGNDLFERFLDGRLVYSCAMFENESDTLESAQKNKLQQIIRKAQIDSSHHLLEIGSGWGAFAIEAAKTTGCRVTTVTLSREQYDHAKRAVELEHLEHLIDVQLCDYREIRGEFDRIVSIEMLEAVGHENLGLFFETCNRLLKPNGLIALQFITVPDSVYESYRTSCDWIQKYIFPGGHCPSLTAVCSAVTEASPFVVEHLENIGPSYARTLREWRSRFKDRAEELNALGYGKEFQRMWEYYLSYCEAGFATRSLSTLQMVLTRPNNTSLGTCPGYSQ